MIKVCIIIKVIKIAIQIVKVTIVNLSKNIIPILIFSVIIITLTIVSKCWLIYESMTFLSSWVTTTEMMLGAWKYVVICNI